MFQAKLYKTILISVSIFAGMLIASPISHAEDLPVCPASATTNSFNTFIEQSAQGIDNFNIDTARVVELTEPLPGGGSSSTSAIVDAYKGTCCKTSDCTETVHVYASKLSDCNSYAGNTEENGKVCTPIQLIISTEGVSLLKFYILQIYIWAASIVGIIAVLIIVISGIQIAASGGTDQVSSAKTRITQSLAGLAILFLSALILYTINPTFFTR